MYSLLFMFAFKVFHLYSLVKFVTVIAIDSPTSDVIILFMPQHTWKKSAAHFAHIVLSCDEQLFVLCTLFRISKAEKCDYENYENYSFSVENVLTVM